MTLTAYYKLMRISSKYEDLSDKDLLVFLEDELFSLCSLLEPQDDQNQKVPKFVKAFRELDLLINDTLDNDAFRTHPRLKKAYPALEVSTAAIFTEKGIPKLREVRNEIWSAV